MNPYAMQKYEEMFFNDKEALEKLIIDLIGKSMVYKSDENPAEKELAEIKEQVDYSYEISASAEFTLDYNTIDANAEFTDVKDFKEFKAKEGENWLNASELDKWCYFEPIEMGELYVDDPEISVKFDGVSDTASTEAQVKMEEIYKVQRKEFILNQTNQRLEEAKQQIAQLQAQIIEDEKAIAAVNTGKTIVPVA